MTRAKILAISSAVLATLSGCAMQAPQQDYKHHRYDMRPDSYAQYMRELSERDYEIALMKAQLAGIKETLHEVIQERNNLQIQVDSLTMAGRPAASHMPVNRMADRASPEATVTRLAAGADTETTPSPRSTSSSISMKKRQDTKVEEERLQSDLYRALSAPGEGQLLKTSLTTSTPNAETSQPPQEVKIVEYFDVLIRAESADQLNKLDSFLSEHGVSDKFKSNKGNTYTLFLGTFSKVEYAAERRRKVGGISGIMPTIVRRVPGSV